MRANAEFTRRAQSRAADRRFSQQYGEIGMERVIRFDGPKAARRFELVRVAVTQAGDGKGERARERIRREARILDALDTISAPKDAAQPDGDRVLGESVPYTLTLDQADHKLVEDYLNSTPWLPRTSRDAVDAQDWWESAEKVEK